MLVVYFNWGQPPVTYLWRLKLKNQVNNTSPEWIYDVCCSGFAQQNVDLSTMTAVIASESVGLGN